MIGLSENQLEVITEAAEPLPEDKCQEFLERVAAVLQARGQVSNDDVVTAVHLALGALIYNSAAWKNWKRNRISTRQNGQGCDAPLAGPHAALVTRRVWRLPLWCTKVRNWTASVFAAALAWDRNKHYWSAARR